MELKMRNTNLQVLCNLVIDLPWPILKNGISVSMSSKPLSILITAKKCEDDAWPHEYGGRSKLDINYLQPWKEFFNDRLLVDHVEAQFSCNKVIMLPLLSQVLSPLDQVRDLIRAIFYSHHHNSFQLMEIHGPGNSNNQIFFIRIHPPVRKAPNGSPLLLVSVIDYERLEELIGQGKLDRQAFQSNYHQIITEGVSKEVCVLRASTIEELNLLRYNFRVNSTKMRRSAWQSKNLPRDGDHPWITAFITPLYQARIKLNCFRFPDGFQTDELKSTIPGTRFAVGPDTRIAFILTDPIPVDQENRYDYASCSNCYVRKVHFQMCGKCRRAFYCSDFCQKKHEQKHKVMCDTFLL